MEVNYLKLLKYEKELKLKGKSLSKENEQDYKKLLKYEVSLLDHFKWEQKDRLSNTLRFEHGFVCILYRDILTGDQ